MIIFNGLQADSPISVWFYFGSVPKSEDDPDVSAPSVHPIFYGGDLENSGPIIDVGHLSLSANNEVLFHNMHYRWCCIQLTCILL